MRRRIRAAVFARRIAVAQAAAEARHEGGEPALDRPEPEPEPTAGAASTSAG